MITLVLADDHGLVRHGLRALLDAEPDMRVLAEAGDGRAAIEAAERLRPDVVLADLMMPGLGGLDVARHVAGRLPRTRVVLLSMYGGEAYVAEALALGAAGFVLKQSGGSDLARAVRCAAAGERFLSPPIDADAVEAYRPQGGLDLLATLTDREREVLRLAAEGLSGPQIAERLVIGVRTVETHRARVLQKLGLRGQTELVRFAIRSGLVDLSPYRYG